MASNKNVKVPEWATRIAIFILSSISLYYLQQLVGDVKDTKTQFYQYQKKNDSTNIEFKNSIYVIGVKVEDMQHNQQVFQREFKQSFDNLEMNTHEMNNSLIKSVKMYNYEWKYANAKGYGD